MLLLVDGCLVILCLSSLFLIRKNRNGNVSLNNQAYILCNRVTHTRLLPAPASHAFSYPTLALLVSLRALESGKLNLARGWVFGYGGLWGRLTGLRANPYLYPTLGKHTFISEKLARVLSEQGHDSDELYDAWMMTMPSYCGFEGINPLTVYFCYRNNSTEDGVDLQIYVVVLEIHNTFGESHVHVLKIGENEETPDKGYEYKWTFLRQFHVSPFNDRSGFYSVSVKVPSIPPNPFVSSVLNVTPQPAVRIHLHTVSPTSPGPLKLAAHFHAITSTPLTTPALLNALARAPFALLLSFPRIAYHAWILHYRRSLDVFARPEPHPRAESVRWQSLGLLERIAACRVHTLLRARSRDLGVRIVLTSTDPSVLSRTFDQRASEDGNVSPQTQHTLTITYLSARTYTTLLVAPSPVHALLLSAAERTPLFQASDPALFCRVFTPVSPANSHMEASASLLQRVRQLAFPGSLIPIPSRHVLDPPSVLGRLANVLLVSILISLERLERIVYSAVRARFVRGDEPWGRWERVRRTFGDSIGGLTLNEMQAELRQYMQKLGTTDAVGSVLRER